MRQPGNQIARRILLPGVVIARADLPKPDTTMCSARTGRPVEVRMMPRTRVPLRGGMLALRNDGGWLCGIVVFVWEVMPHLPINVPNAGPRLHADPIGTRLASSI